jgi:sugar phosphate permease
LNSSPPPEHKPRFFYGWIIVLTVALGGFGSSTEAFPVLSVFLKPVTEEFGWSRQVFTAPLTIGGLVGSVAALATGPMVDRFGSRWALTGAYAIVGSSFVLMSLMDNMLHYYVLQILARSMNTGVLAVATAVIIPNWFIVKRGKAMSLGNLGFPIGAAFMPLFVQMLITIDDWRAAALGVGILILTVSTIPVALFIRRRPEDMGLFPDGDIRDRSLERSTDVQPGSRFADVSFTFKQASRMPVFYLLTIAGTFWWFGRAGLILHVVPYLTDHGVSDQMAVAALVTQSAVGTGGALVAGYLRDRFSVRYVLAIDFTMTAGGTLLLMAVGPAWLAIVWGVTYGFAQGASVPLQRLIFADYFGRRHLGSIEGVVRSAQNIAQALGPLAGAVAFDATQSYTSIFTVFFFCNVVAIVLVLLARAPAHAIAESRAD